MAQGIQEGIQGGKSSLLLKQQLSRKLGNIPDEIKVRLHHLTSELLDVLSEALFNLESLEDLYIWLQNIDN
ncbi:hypothetical protein Syn7502_03374 [Synechococcus sp. PCC 7502]|uniref:DUF4351 domain-containing protein n=1 Tax=Synechococcus sp. PCC 7502 TaxID=1173263 RepID=UPI00029FDCB2|nr:DUF4351 domain-containing protein [Synechococcus sp. PCC 7502]AFY75227.1 hypothetical protein Syn7502_03374 [Synechococcus sp. PCC 7502]